MSISHLLLGVENTLTKSNIPSPLPPDEDVAMPKAARIPAEADLTPVRRAKLLERVAAFYHQRFLDRPEGQQYLVKARGLRNVSLFGDYRIGYAEGSLLQALPQDAESLDMFRQLGVLNGRHREVLARCVVFPLFDAADALASLYGCRIEDGVPCTWVSPAACGMRRRHGARRDCC